MAHIFVSYTTADRHRVRPLLAALETIAPVWWDGQIAPGDRWDDAIERALQEASCVVVVWTRKSVHARWVKAEARYGLQHGILIPVRLDRIGVPIEFSDLQAAQLETWDGSSSSPTLRAFLASVTNAVARNGQTPRTETLAGEPAVPPGQPRWKRWAAGVATAGALAVGAILSYRGGDGGRDSTRQTPVPPAPAETRTTPVIKGIVISETGTADVPSALGGMRKDDSGLDYHYIVDASGGVYALRAVAPSDTVIAVGMVHVLNENSPLHRPYTPKQREATEGLLALEADTYGLRPTSIRSIQEIDSTKTRHITVEMDEVREHVGRVLGLWRLHGGRPAGAIIRIDTVGHLR